MINYKQLNYIIKMKSTRLAPSSPPAPRESLLETLLIRLLLGT